MGERYFFLPDFMRVLSEAGLAYMQPDPMRAGGLSQTRTVADLCDARKVAFAPHNSPGTGPVATAASLHLAASSHAFAILETREQLSDAEQQACSLRLEPEDGHVALPKGPGLGIELDWDRLVRDPVVAIVMPRAMRVDGTVGDY
jgi:galactonate dehydratase